jgi:CubicO group peptidase (beta-lactamase class C family)
MSALTGIAIKEKLITNVDQKISDFLPDYFKDVDNVNKKDISIRNVLTMSGGLEPIDSYYPGYFSSADWLDYTIKKPLIDNPGKKFNYNTGLPHLLSAIITKTSKMSTLDFANKYLFSQIGVSVENWDQDPLGYYGGGSGIYLKPEDMAKFGYLYLNNGLWDGKQIIPEEWIEESTKEQIECSSGLDYGYLFWIQNMNDKVHNKTYFTFRADGMGGQKIVVIPDLDMVIVITANAQSSSIDKTDDQDIITDYILPSVIN